MDNTLSDNELLAFKAIMKFVQELFSAFPDILGLKLYNHLISKTSLVHVKAIKKHINAFKKFVEKNRESIYSKKSEQLKSGNSSKITYSDKARIDMKKIFKLSDKDTSEVIWKHLLILSALLDPTGKAKEVLKSDKSKEGDFLKNILNKVEEHSTGKSNPMEIITSIMSSGVANEIMSGMTNGLQDGSLDLSKMLGSVQNLMGSLQSANSDSPNPMPALDLSSIFNSLTTLSPSADGKPPNLTEIMNTVMSNMQPPNAAPVESKVMNMPPVEIEDVESSNKVEEIPSKLEEEATEPKPSEEAAEPSIEDMD